MPVHFHGPHDKMLACARLRGARHDAGHGCVFFAMQHISNCPVAKPFASDSVKARIGDAVFPVEVHWSRDGHRAITLPFHVCEARVTMLALSLGEILSAWIPASNAGS